MAKRGIAVIGCGWAGRVHADCLQQLIEANAIAATLVVACDCLSGRAEQFAKQFQFCQAVSDPMEALRHPDVSVVYICTPTNEHKNLVLEAAKQGLDIFCEKPLARTAEDAQSMADAVDTAGVMAQVGLVLRYSPIFVELKRLLADREFTGRPMAVVFRDDQCIPSKGEFQSQWRVDAACAGGGTLIEHSIHDLDLLNWYFGPAKQVFAQTASFSGHQGVEDVATVMLTFNNGLQATLQSVWHNVEKRASERRLEIFCERAWLRSTGDFQGEIEIQTKDQSPEIVAFKSVLQRFAERFLITKPDQITNAFLNENLAYWHCLENGKKPGPGFSVAVQAHRVVDAIYESAKRGVPVNVEHVTETIDSVAF